MASLCDARFDTGQRSAGWTERRDARHTVLIRAKMRAGGLPADVCIRDISARGVCVVSPAPPVRGTIVELTGGYLPIVGRVVWTGENRFGIEVRGRLNVAGYLTQQKQPGLRPPHELVPVPGSPGFARPVQAARVESRLVGNAMQFMFAAFLAGCAAVFIGQTVYENLSQTSASVVEGLEPTG